MRFIFFIHHACPSATHLEDLAVQMSKAWAAALCGDRAESPLKKCIRDAHLADRHP